MHLLLHCLKAKLLWNLFLATVGVQWDFPYSIRGTLLSCHGSFVGKKWRKMWMVAPLCLFWTIWCERNWIAFDYECCLAHRLKTSLFF